MKHAVRKAGIYACMSLLVVALVALAACSSPQATSSSEPGKSQLSATSDVPASLVPNVISLTMSDAEKSIVASGFKLGKVKHENSDTVPRGNVISQSPEPLSQGNEEKTVELVVSKGKAKPKEVNVPDVKGLTQVDAEKKLSDAGLFGICDGSAESSEVDPGLVFKQSVDPGTKVVEGTKVTFTIAIAPSTVSVPNVIGMSEKDASGLIAQAGLSFDTTSVYSNDVAEGLVITQSYAPGAEVQVGTTVSVTLSLGPAPTEQVTVPYVLTYSWSDAEYALDSAGLIARYTGNPAGVVVDQDYDAGQVVDAGTIVTLTLGTPSELVEVPDLTGLSVTAAEAITDSLGLSLDGMNHGTVTEQVPDAGTLVERGATVSIQAKDDEIDYTATMVTVPNLVGMTAEAALEAVSTLGLSLDGENHGTVIDQRPPAGEEVVTGSTISVKMDTSDFTDSDTVTVPNLIGMSAETAYETATALGFSLDGESHGTVVEQRPEAGTELERGETISVKMDTSDFE